VVVVVVVVWVSSRGTPVLDDFLDQCDGVLVADARHRVCGRNEGMRGA
jgi:hypothetical protein